MKFELQHVTKKFNDKYAVRNISINGEKSKIIAIIGPSGSGKTTLLRLINMLDSPSTGSIRIDGKDPTPLSRTERFVLQKRMTMVFQNPSLFQRTVEANVAYGLKIRNIDSTHIEKQVSQALRVVGLEGLRHQFAPSLSAGEAQRVTFARAIVVKPELLLLDEFTANLDHANVKLLEKGVIKYHQKNKGTIVLATHNLFQAKRLADKVIFLFDGKVIEQAEKQEFFNHPRNTLTQSFLSGELVY